MIVDERMVTYIRSLERPENPVIEAIEQEALENFRTDHPQRNPELFKGNDVNEPPGQSAGGGHSSRIFGNLNE